MELRREKEGRFGRGKTKVFFSLNFTRGGRGLRRLSCRHLGTAGGLVSEDMIQERKDGGAEQDWSRAIFTHVYKILISKISRVTNMDQSSGVRGGHIIHVEQKYF